MSLYVTGMLAVAAILALVGTDNQARLTRSRLLADPDPLIAEAGRLWRPPPRVISQRPSRRRRCAAIEAELRQDPERSKRYDVLCTELFAWNALETSVALATVASVFAIIALL
jgi:hypothetical protein